MANSKDRRKLRRQIQEAGLGNLLHLSTDSPPAPLPAEARLSKRLLAVLSLLLAVLGGVFAFVQFYPWLEIGKDESLSSGNPFRTMFVAENQGYAFVSNIQVWCGADLKTSDGFSFTNNNVHFSVAGNYGHGERFTLPCTRTVALKDGQVPSAMGLKGARLVAAGMRVIIAYSLIELGPLHVRRSQQFYLRAVRADDGSFHWEYSK